MPASAETLAQRDIQEQDRQFQRIDVALFGRFMLENHQEFPCQIINMSPGNASVATPQTGKIGEKVIAYIDHIGRLEGEILRVFSGGFAMSFASSVARRDKLAAKLTWLANRHELNLAEDRRHERFPLSRRLSDIRLEDGRAYKARVIDVSLSGAAIEMDVRPAVGTKLWVGQTGGRVVRHFEDGFAVEFSAVQMEDSLRQFLAA